MDRLSAKGRAWVLFGGAVVMAAGFFMIARDVLQWREGNASLLWKSVQGRITESEATRIADGIDSGGGHSIRIRYQYEVGGRRHEGDRVNIGNLLDPEVRRDIATVHPVGSAVTVFYDPEDPSRSVLENGSSFSLPSAFLPGGVLVGIAGIVVFAAATDRLRTPTGEP